MTDLTRYTLTPVHGLPVPSGGDPNRIPADLGALAEVIDTQGSILRRLDAAQIAALTPAQRPIGLTVHNLTLGCAQVWDGAAWVPYVLAPRWRDYTVRVRQGSTELPPTGATRARWAQIGQVVHVQVEAMCNPPGGAVGAVAISLPAVPAGWSLIGTGCIRDNTLNPVYAHAQRVSVSGDAGGWAGFYRENGAQVGDGASIRLTHVELQATYEAA